MGAPVAAVPAGTDNHPMSSVRLLTEVPGPKSRTIQSRREAVISRALASTHPVVITSGHGAIVEDVDGNRFLDFAGGIGTLNVGHTATPVAGALQTQAGSLTHMCFAVAPYEGYISLAERLAALTPGRFAKKVMFVNSGAEAVENAIKIARYASQRPGILCFEDAFHGRTFMALSLTSKVTPYKAGFGTLAPDVHRVPYAYCYRCSYCETRPTCDTACVDAIEDYFRRYVDPALIAAVIVEPVLGEGGFVVPPREFLQKLVAVCRRHGILIIADEVQTGFGRTGRMFACEHSGVEPDLLVAAKSIAGGLPLGAVIGRADLMDAAQPGGLGGTFGGNPLALAAAHAVLDIFTERPLLQRAEAIGARIEARMRDWAAGHPIIGDVRRLGAMAAMELVRSRDTKEPAKRETDALVKLACERGLLLIPAGTYGNIVRLLVPLVIEDAELDEGLDVLGSCVAAVDTTATI